MARQERLTTVIDPEFSSELDRRIGKMRLLLAAMAPESASAALRALRNAFPEEPLDLRLRALKETH